MASASRWNVGTSLTRRTKVRGARIKSPASREAGVSTKPTFRLFADADHAHGARTVHLLHPGSSPTRSSRSPGRRSRSRSRAPAVMTEAPRRSGGRGERGNAESGNGGEAENGLADHDVLLWSGLSDWFIRSVVAAKKEVVHDTMLSCSCLNLRSALPLAAPAAISRRNLETSLLQKDLIYGARAHLLDPQARCDQAQHHRRRQRDHRKAGLRIIAQKRVRITREQAETFYGVHRERPFFGELVEFMTSGPVVVQVLEGEDAIAKYRDVMGATDPGQGRGRHHPQGARAVDRREFRARFRRARHRGARDRAVLFGERDRQLSA